MFTFLSLLPHVWSTSQIHTNILSFEKIMSLMPIFRSLKLAALIVDVARTRTIKWNTCFYHFSETPLNLSIPLDE